MTLNEYLSERGRLAALARTINVSSTQINSWLSNKRPVPPKRASLIESATNGAVTRRDLRPDDFAEIWPELVADRQPEQMQESA